MGRDIAMWCNYCFEFYLGINRENFLGAIRGNFEKEIRLFFFFSNQRILNKGSKPLFIIVKLLERSNSQQ